LFWRVPLVGLLVLLNAGCERELPLALSPDAQVEVTELGGPHFMLAPGTEAHRSLERWVASNRSGWTPYYATLPGKGIIARAGALDLQFLDSTAFAQTPKGPFQRAVTPAEYAFLKRSANGT